MASVSGKSYGGCVGSDSTYVKLIASDGHEFIVKRELALMCGTLKNMLSWPCGEDESQDLRLMIIPPTLERVCMWLSYKNHYHNSDEENVPDFKITEDICKDLLRAANFLDC